MNPIDNMNTVPIDDEPLLRERNHLLEVNRRLVEALESLMRDFVGDRSALNCLGESGKTADNARSALAFAKGQP